MHAKCYEPNSQTRLSFVKIVGLLFSSLRNGRFGSKSIVFASSNAALGIFHFFLGGVGVVLLHVGCVCFMFRVVAYGHADADLTLKLVQQPNQDTEKHTKVSRALFELSTKSSSQASLPGSNRSKIVLPPKSLWSVLSQSSHNWKTYQT